MIKSNLGLFIGLILAAAVTVLVFVTLGAANSTYTALVANTDIGVGQRVDSTMFVEAELQGSPDGSTISRTDFDEQLAEAIATTNIYEGQTIRREMFYLRTDSLDEDGQAGVATRFSELLSSPDRRAIIVPGDVTSSFIRAGDTIDVVFVANGSFATKVIMTKRVLWVQAGPPPVDETGQPTAPAPVQYVLDINKQESQDLIFAQQIGVLLVSLAAPDSELTPELEITNELTSAEEFAERYEIDIAFLDVEGDFGGEDLDGDGIPDDPDSIDNEDDEFTEVPPDGEGEDAPADGSSEESTP